MTNSSQHQRILISRGCSLGNIEPTKRMRNLYDEDAKVETA